MQQIIDYIMNNWVAWIFAGAWAVSKINFRKLRKKLETE